MNKSKRRVEIGKQLGQYNLDNGGTEYFSNNGKKSAAVRHARFTTPEEKKAYYSELGKKSRALAKQKRLDEEERAKAAKNPLAIINNFLTGKRPVENAS